MKIRRIRIYQVAQPLLGGEYRLSGGRTFSTLDSTIVSLESDCGLTGWGESCPFGSSYGPAFGAGVRTGIAELAPVVLGADPRQHKQINALMDTALKGHPYAKSAIDIACWDLAGHGFGVPVHQLLGGRLVEWIDVNSSIPVNDARVVAGELRARREAGFRLHSVKLSGDPALDIERIRAVAEAVGPRDRLTVDCNGGWLQHEAMRVVRAVADLDIYIEQPCAGYEPFLAVRRASPHPFIMDESASDLEAVIRAHIDRACDVVKFKISRLGGLTRARQLRDFCESVGLSVWIQDAAGCDLTTAAIAQLAHSTDEKFLLGALHCGIFTETSVVTGAPELDAGRMQASERPGLGVEPRLDVLGDPVAVYQ